MKSGIQSDQSAPLRIGAVILMAGTSTRMGEKNKLLLKIDGVPMGRKVVESIFQAGFSPIVVVTGHDAESIRKMLCHASVSFVHNEQYLEGMGSSIRKAFLRVSGWDAGLIAMGDMPFVSVKMLQKIREAYTAGGHTLIAPGVAGRRGQPVLFDARYFDGLRRCAGDVGARGILKENRSSLHLIEVGNESIFWDVDTPDSMVVYRQQSEHE